MTAAASIQPVPNPQPRCTGQELPGRPHRRGGPLGWHVSKPHFAGHRNVAAQPRRQLLHHQAIVGRLHLLRGNSSWHTSGQMAPAALQLRSACTLRSGRSACLRALPLPPDTPTVHPQPLPAACLHALLPVAVVARQQVILGLQPKQGRVPPPTCEAGLLEQSSLWPHAAHAGQAGVGGTGLWSSETPTMAPNGTAP